MIHDLRLGNCITVQKGSNFVHGIVTGLDHEDKVKYKPLDEKNNYGTTIENIHPLKVTKKWLRDNEFNEEFQEGIDEEQKYVHQNLPIIYSHNNHRLFIYGRIFPVKVPYIHQLQNILLDCGIDLEVKIKVSHCTQVECTPISQLLGGMKKSRDFFDTNSAFGFSGMPKLTLGDAQKAISSRTFSSMPKLKSINDYQIDYQNRFRESFININEIIDDEVRNLARFFFNNPILDTIDRTRVLGTVLEVSPGVFVIQGYKSDLRSNLISLNGIIEFINSWNRIVLNNNFYLALDLPDNEEFEHIILENTNIQKALLRYHFYEEIIWANRTFSKGSLYATPVSEDIFKIRVKNGRVIKARSEFINDVLFEFRALIVLRRIPEKVFNELVVELNNNKNPGDSHVLDEPMFGFDIESENLTPAPEPRVANVTIKEADLPKNIRKKEKRKKK